MIAPVFAGFPETKMVYLPENLLDDILSKLDIVEVISGYLPLKRAGRNFKTLCPFHQEKTSSFMVSPERQIYHCFGCGAGGNAFNFLMRYEHLEFPEAVEILAKKAGVSLPKREENKKEGSSLIFYKINELVCNFYQNILNSPSGAEAKNYLLKRDINLQTQKLFGLGFSPNKWDALIQCLREKGFSLSLLEKAGLTIPKEDGGYYDRFRNRVIFPIFDIKSRVLGFGGRILTQTKGEKEEELAKYINSPQTPIYVKGRHLYGLNFAKDAIINEDAVVIVEGYIDCIIPYQEGLHNIVASLGTAFTPEQAKAIKRYTHNVVMVYDGDDAGQVATLRSLDIFLEEEMQVKVVGLSEGYDPDTYVRRYGIEAFKKLIASSQGLFDYKLNTLKSRYSPREIEGKLKVAQEMLVTISKFQSLILKSNYIKRLSEELEIKEEILLLELKKVKNYSSSVRLQQVQRKALDINPTEKLLIKLMLDEQEIIKDIMANLTPSDFQDERTSKIVSIMFDLVSQGKRILASNLLNYFQEQDLSQIICELTVLPDMPVEDRNRIIEDCIHRLKEQRLKERRNHLHKEIKLAQELKDEGRLKHLLEEFCRLTKTASK